MKTDRAREVSIPDLSWIVSVGDCDRCGKTRYGEMLWSHRLSPARYVGFYCFACLDGSEP